MNPQLENSQATEQIQIHEITINRYVQEKFNKKTGNK